MAKNDLIKPQNPTELSVFSEPDTLTPKFATTVTVAKTKAGNYIFSFISGLKGEQQRLIERVMLEDHVVKQLKKIIDEVKGPEENE